VEEGQSVRIFGAWFGNEIDRSQAWIPVLEKINSALDNWDQSHPSIERRRLIVRMVVGGMTQYLTQVQWMPKNIEKRLSKRIRRYMWKDSDHSYCIHD
jgi:hypothetical protein